MRGMLAAGCVLIGMALLWAFLDFQGDWRRTMPALVIAAAGTWSLLLMARFWPGPTDDSLTRRLVQGLIGVGSALAVWLDGYAVGGDLIRPRRRSRIAIRCSPYPTTPAFRRWSARAQVLRADVRHRIALVEDRFEPERGTSFSKWARSRAVGCWAFVLLFRCRRRRTGRETAFASVLMIAAAG